MNLKKYKLVLHFLSGLVNRDYLKPNWLQKYNFGILHKMWFAEQIYKSVKIN